ncbi:MAG TPA: Fe-S cluster assembly protein SufB [Bacilli bacterium]|nr:Fe-S cluster assembly protein SufB [Bacilli bacterium]
MEDIQFEKYKYGFSDRQMSSVQTGIGLNEEVVRKISELKGEPEWMLEFRLNAFKGFKESKAPAFGPDLSVVKFDSYTYFNRVTDNEVKDWDDVPQEIKNTFQKLGIPEAEQKYLAGAAAQYDSEVVYHNMLDEVVEKGVIFLSTDEALKQHPELFKKYFNTVVAYDDNRFTALNGAVWSGGSFIYVPPGVKLEKPLQSYFRINYVKMGQFERTLIIVDEGADVNYVEGCTAPIYSEESLHAAVVEIVVLKNAKCRYTTIQNWSNNIVNLVTKRALVHAGGHMEWIDGNIGSLINMKYPSCILIGEGAKGTTISIAVAGEGQIQDAGARMIHLAPNTSSTIISKSIVHGGGTANYRGKVRHTKRAYNSQTHVECDTLLLDDISKSDTIPINMIENNQSYIEHEATVSKISEDQLFYLMSRGISEEDATQMIVMGFIEPFSRELPMEYALELNRLIKLDMEGSVG